MAAEDDLAGCIGGLIGVMLVVTAVLFAVLAIATAGSVFGAGVAVRNYGTAFRRHVRPERSAS